MNATTNHQLNPYAIQLCTLSRWISAKQWAPAGSGQFSIRSSEHSCLITRANKDKGELSPHDLIQLCWPDGEAALTADVTETALLHIAIYQSFPVAKVVLHTQSVAANAWSKLIKTDDYLFSGYEVQTVISGQPAQQASCKLVIIDAIQSLPLQASELQQRTAEFQSGLLIRGHGLYVWGDSLEQTKRQLEAWEFLISCELEQLKVTGLKP